MLQQYGNRLVAGTFSATTAAQLLTTAALTLLVDEAPAKVDATTGAWVGNQIWGFCITNNSANIIYIDFTSAQGTANTVSSTNYYRQIPAGGFFEISAGPGVLNTMQIIAATGTSACHLVVFG